MTSQNQQQFLIIALFYIKKDTLFCLVFPTVGQTRKRNLRSLRKFCLVKGMLSFPEGF